MKSENKYRPRVNGWRGDCPSLLITSWSGPGKMASEEVNRSLKIKFVLGLRIVAKCWTHGFLCHRWTNARHRGTGWVICPDFYFMTSFLEPVTIYWLVHICNNNNNLKTFCYLPLSLNVNQFTWRLLFSATEQNGPSSRGNQQKSETPVTWPPCTKWSSESFNWWRFRVVFKLTYFTPGGPSILFSRDCVSPTLDKSQMHMRRSPAAEANIVGWQGDHWT